jgi:hypothetical protein
MEKTCLRRSSLFLFAYIKNLTKLRAFRIGKGERIAGPRFTKSRRIGRAEGGRSNWDKIKIFIYVDYVKILWFFCEDLIVEILRIFCGDFMDF